MTDTPENLPAFPFTYEQADGLGGSYACSHPGMTLRDWFAGQSLAGFVSAPSDTPYGHVISSHKKIPPEAIAGLAYELADAMLRARAIEEQSK